MTPEQFSDLLRDLWACKAGREFARGKSLKEVWETCHRADWLLWLAEKMVGTPGWPTRQEVVSAACDCAETALQLVSKEEERVRKCIETTRAWVRGEATPEDVRQARRAAADACEDVHADGAHAAAYAAHAAAEGVLIAFVAAYAAATGVARKKALEDMASIVRRSLKPPTG